MASFDFDLTVSLGHRLTAFADDLETEGHGDRAAQIRRRVRTYRALMKDGEVTAAIESVAVLRPPGTDTAAGD